MKPFFCFRGTGDGCPCGPRCRCGPERGYYVIESTVRKAAHKFAEREGLQDGPDCVSVVSLADQCYEFYEDSEHIGFLIHKASRFVLEHMRLRRQGTPPLATSDTICTCGRTRKGHDGLDST